MKYRYFYLEIIGWFITIICFLGGIGWLDSETIDEFTTFIVLLLLSYYIKKGIWYYMTALSLGILLDAPIDPYCLTNRQFSWIVGSLILLVIYYIVKLKKSRNNNEHSNIVTSINKEDANRKSSII